MTTTITINTNGGKAVNVKVFARAADGTYENEPATYLVEAGISNYTTHVTDENYIVIEEVHQRSNADAKMFSDDSKGVDNDDSAANADADATLGSKTPIDENKGKIVTDKDIKDKK